MNSEKGKFFKVINKIAEGQDFFNIFMNQNDRCSLREDLKKFHITYDYG